MAQRGRPRLLSAERLEALIAFVEAGLPPAQAARAAGVAPRSLRRWRAAGQREIDQLSAEARLALACSKAAKDESAWRESARFFEAQNPERWADPLDGADELFDDPATISP